MSDPNELTAAIIGAAIEIHRALGPGLLESAYKECLALELMERGLAVERERALPLVYRDRQVGIGYRLDLIVEDCVIVEVKSVARLEPVHDAQLLSYLRLSSRHVGLLFNFNVKRLVEKGLQRVVRDLPEDTPGE